MKNRKTKKQRDYGALALIERQGSGSGYHSKRGYSRRKKYQDDWLDEAYGDWEEEQWSDEHEEE